MNSFRRPRLLSGIFLALLTTSAMAQEETPDSTTPAAATEADTQASESDTRNSLPKTWNRLIYVPYRQLENVFNSNDATAVVPYAEYLQLLRHYLRDDTAEEAPEAVITRAVYEAAVEDDVARITAELSITVLREDGWAVVPVSFGQSAIGRLSSSDDDSTILKGIDEGRCELLLRGAGQKTVTLELLASVSTTPEARTFEMSCPAVGISELQVTIPEGDQTVRISPVEVLLPAEGSDASQTVARAALGSARQFSVQWFPKAGSRPQMDLLASVSTDTRVNIEPQLVQTTSQFTWEVLRGEMQEATVLVPTGARIIDVVATTGRIHSWAATAGNGHQQVRIQLLSPVSDKLQIAIQTERVPESDTLQLLGRTDNGPLHGVHADSVVRESGRITVSTDASLTLVTQQQSGVKRISSTQENTAGSLSWEHSGVRSRLVVQTRPVEPRLTANQTSRLVFGDNVLQLTANIQFTVERAGVFELQLKYPDSLTIDGVTADGMSEFNVDRDGGVVTLSLTNRRQGKIGVYVRGHQDFDAAADNLETVLPSIEPLHVERSTGQVTVLAPRFLDVVTIEEQRTGLTPSGSPAGAVGNAHPVSAWTFNRQPWTLAVRTSPRPAQLDAVVATTAQIDPEVIRFQSEIRFSIRNAGLDRFRVAVPEAVSNAIRFRSLNSAHVIQQRDRAAEAEDGWVTWTLTLQNEVTGTVRITADWEQPLTEAAEQKVRTLTAEPPRVLNPYPEGTSRRRRVTLTQARGELRLLRHESLSITADGSGDTTEQIDVRELEFLPREGFLAFRYFAQPASATISIREHEIHDVVATVVSRAAVEIVTEKQSLAAYRCRYRITSSLRQRLLIQVPVDSELQAPTINGRRTTFEPAAGVESAEGWEAYYINISRKENSDSSFLLSFQLRCPIIEAGRFPYEGQGGTQILRTPQIGDNSGSTVVQETRLGLWTPKDVSVFGDPDHWTAVRRPSWSLFKPLQPATDRYAADSLTGWIGGDSSDSEFAHQGNAIVFQALGRETMVQFRWWNRPFMIAVISGAFVLIGLILRNTSWENRITMVLLGVVVVSVGALFDAGAAQQIMSAGSIGLIAVAGIWVVTLLRGTPAKTDASPEPPDSQSDDDSGDDGDDSPDTPEPAGTSSTDESDLSPSAVVSPAPEVTNTIDRLMGGK